MEFDCKSLHLFFSALLLQRQTLAELELSVLGHAPDNSSRALLSAAFEIFCGGPAWMLQHVGWRKRMGFDQIADDALGKPL